MSEIKKKITKKIAVKKSLPTTEQVKDDCIFVKLSDGVFLDLTQVQAYRHEEGCVGRVYLKGGNNFETPCGEELVMRLRQHRIYS